MKDLSNVLAAHRRRIRFARVAEAAVRWAFYASVLACVYLAASKILGLSVPHAAAVTVLAAIPLAMAVREWARAFSVRDCAVHLDRVLGLEERLATAVEVPGAMAGVLTADASVALARASLPAWRAPREAKLMVPSLLLMGALFMIPEPERSGAVDDPALVAVMEAEAAKLEELGKVHVEFKEVADLLREGDPEAAVRLLRELERRFGEKVLDSGDSDAEARRLQEAAGMSAQALGAELTRAGITLHAPPPKLAEKKLERQQDEGSKVSPGEVHAPPALRTVSETILARDWGPRYDPVIRNYFGGTR